MSYTGKIGLALLLALVGEIHAQNAPDGSNMSCVERLEIPIFPPLASAIRLSAVVTASVTLDKAGSVQSVSLDIVGGSTNLFSPAVEKSVRASAFLAACGGKTVTAIFEFHPGQQLGAQRTTFSYPNRFSIFSPAMVVQP